MVYLVKNKTKRPVILNAVIKKKRIRKKEECFCDIATSDLTHAIAPKKFRSLRLAFMVMVLALYCVMLAFLVKTRLASRGIDLIPKLSRLASRNQHGSFMTEPTIMMEEVPAKSTLAVTSVAPIKQAAKLADLEEVSSSRFIASIGPPVLMKKSLTAFGAWMKDPASSHDAIYVMDYYYRNTNVLIFNSTDAFVREQNPETYQVPVEWGGTGHAVYKGHLYFNRYNSSTMCKYNFENREIVLMKNLPNAGYGNMAPYQWAGSTDIDFAVDKDGLWVIYATADSDWNITISKLNEATLQVERTWFTNYRKRSAANAFIANRVLYTLHRYDYPDTMLNYAFDTKTSRYFWPKIPLDIKFGSLASLDYDYRESKLYAWDRGHQVTYGVSFK